MRCGEPLALRRIVVQRERAGRIPDQLREGIVRRRFGGDAWQIVDARHDGGDVGAFARLGIKRRQRVFAHDTDDAFPEHDRNGVHVKGLHRLRGASRRRIGRDQKFGHDRELAGDVAAHAPHECSPRGLGTAGLEQKPADERGPEAAADIVDDRLDDPQRHDDRSERAADAQGDLRRALAVAAQPPEYRVEDAPAVERVGRDDVEHRERDVDECEIAHQGAEAGARADGETQRREQSAQHEARQRTDHRDPRFARRVLGFCIELRDAAEDEQPDTEHLDPPALGDQRVGEFVQQHAGEEKERAEDAEPEPFGGAQVGSVQRSCRIGQRPRDEREDEDPTDIDGDADAE